MCVTELKMDVSGSSWSIAAAAHVQTMTFNVDEFGTSKVKYPCLVVQNLHVHVYTKCYGPFWTPM